MTTKSTRNAHAHNTTHEHEATRAERTPYNEARMGRAYRETSELPTKPDGIDERVMAAVDALPKAQAIPSTHSLSRRAFVLAGAGTAIVAGIGLLGIGVPLLRDDRLGTSNGLVGAGTSSAWDDTSSTLGRIPFGLAVANAAEVATGTKTFDLEPSERGLVPVSASSPGMFTLVMNLSVTGPDIKRVTYSTNGSPQAQWYLIDSGTYYTPAVRFALVTASEEALDNTNPGLGGPRNPNMARFDWLPNQEPITAENVGDAELAKQLLKTEAQGYDVQYPTLSLSYDVDEEGTIDWPGASDPCVALVVAMTDGTVTWDDEVLQAYEAFQLALRTRGEAAASGDAQAQADAQRDVNDAQSALMERILAVCEDADTYLAWLRGCYVEVLTKAADIIGRTTLVVSAELEGGGTAERRYRIWPVEDFEARVADRLDGLLELGGVDVDDELTRMKTLMPTTLMAHFPLFDLVEGVPIDDNGDPRLQAPLFTITDVSADTHILVADQSLDGIPARASKAHDR